MNAGPSDAPASTHWQDFWQGGGKADQALGGAAQRAFLERFWTAFFDDAPVGPRPAVIDVAAGSGAVVARARRLLSARGVSPLCLAVDYAPAAAAALRREAPGAFPLVADAARLPFRAGAADIVVSQFGIEYAGLAAFAEAARILAPGGVFRAVAHYKHGAIDAECGENARLLKTVEDTGLIGCARAALAATYERLARKARPLADSRAEAALRAAARKAADAISAAPDFAAKATLGRFLGDLDRLSTRRLAFEPREALAWLDGMAASLAAYRQRMEAMQAAALDRSSVDAAARTFADAGFVDISARPAAFLEGGEPAAWLIGARRD
ncbi:methyltransferase domain-containing protein [Amphiplicatus metriothermophilus]|uniref:Methyltransferase domain-containing protein n=1 Tax=Amphiplicatus metriothermophilus TaxID=1519374 RepID=A0A239PKS8_9PROT|nr:methyltransferase domain-containing protein [Amphiplicatus metriothermophilus]MBB5517242.1 SAM-dependent methyltransferase [Amphiplicatus metriothermophilus]SNT68422.1 Methyltransferase domain-containing protein [Amphiplicatus metriothermophilus]